MLETVFQLTKGLLELNRGNYQPALEQLEEAENRLKPFVQNQPFSRLYTDIAYKAIALAELEEMEEAEALYQSVLPRLQALNSKRTLERYEAAIDIF